MAQTAIAPAALSRPHPVRTYGLRAGVALAVLELAHGFLSVATPPFAVTLAFFGIAVLVLAYAGYAAGRGARRASAGALTGLIAGLVLSAGYGVGVALGTWINADTVRRQYAAAAAQAHLHVQSLDPLIIAGTLLTIALVFVGGGAVGTVVGVIGGIFGKRRSFSGSV